ncbi:flavin monoamine oxidase family protein [Aphanothece sacrum]|uniref:Amine oxidase domain-containing protein n=1 Tax=Aphanothece sacrum FPU1 TaxID=1920663 RepID=A0A401IHU3_APHSA|nr:FAD-dependent oxidoreductase [Aphanothece sacrum]GBF80862.1 hypothetical protein AsFPU1_2269 [Aphanothece sacrum FPU1]GBF85170.1 amine oxidase [Aphanothece sacrum FPU3]
MNTLIKPLTKTNNSKKVLILGAGIAGLTAAYELNKVGHQVTVLEAKMSSGGRIKTLREQFADELYTEAGAARIPSNHDWVFHYIKHFNLQTSPFYPEQLDFVHYCQNQRIRICDEKQVTLGQYPLDFSEEEKNMTLKDLWHKVFSPFFPEMGDPSLLNWPYDSLKKYDFMTVKEFLISQGISKNVSKMFGLGHMDFSKDKYSALEIFRLTAFGLKENQKVKIVGGFDQLPKAFARHLQDKIFYGAKVFSLVQNHNNVIVFYKKGGFEHKISADYLICTIPFSVLRHLAISPSLSKAKNRAIQEMSYMSASRVFFQVRKRYWLEQNYNGFGLADYPTELWHSTFDLAQQRGILVSYFKGSSSQKITSMIESERVNYAQKQLKFMLPGLIDYLEGGFSFCWDEDEYALGAHSFLNTGQVTQLLPHSASSEGRIHFAGEHTSAWHGWIQGAIESGYRAATEINNLTNTT